MLDLDGTLVDTLGDFEAALGAMLAQLGRPALAREEIARLIGKGSEHLVRQVLLRTGDGAQAVDEGLYAAAWRHYQDAYAGINGRHSRVYPGVVEGLQALRAHGLPLACLTNKPLAHARALLAAKGLERFFVQVFGGDSFARKKPDPLPLLETCRALGTVPARTLMIGDSANDAAAARGAGCPVALVRYGYNHGQDVADVDADAHVDSITELWLAGALP